MERYTIEERHDAAPFEQEAGVSSEQHYAKRADDDWVHELIAMTRPGVELHRPARMTWEREMPFEYDDFS